MSGFPVFGEPFARRFGAGYTIKLIEEAAIAIVQYQLLKLGNRFSQTG